MRLTTKIAALVGISMVAVAAVALPLVASGSAETPPANAALDAGGNLHVPEAYRSTYEFLGDWAVAAGDGQGSKELHLVFASPGTTAAFRKTGAYPDGAVLVKEVFGTATRGMTTGTVSHADQLKGWFVMVKDSAGERAKSHPDSKLWGDGWGWAWFDAAEPKKTTSTDYRTNCKSCHIPAQSTDWIYNSGYPTLKTQ